MVEGELTIHGEVRALRLRPTDKVVITIPDSSIPVEEFEVFHSNCAEAFAPNKVIVLQGADLTIVGDDEGLTQIA